TRFSRDWSSDVCSSDLETTTKRIIISEIEASINAFNAIGSAGRTLLLRSERNIYALTAGGESDMVVIKYPTLVRPTHAVAYFNRSEERRVGKGWRSTRS